MELPLLQSKPRLPSSTFIPPHPTQLPPRVKRHPNPNPNPNPNTTLSLNKTKLISLISLISLFSLLLLVSASLRLSPPSAPNPNPFGVVIYGSVTRTLVHVFASLDPKLATYSTTGEGLVSGDPERNDRVLRDLVGFAKGRVPEREWRRTKVTMMVGEGAVGRREEEEREALFATCRGVLRGSGFSFEDGWVSMLHDNGREKAIYDWVAANYAFGNLGKEPEKTNGIVKLGGTSVQVTIPTLDLELASDTIRLAGVTYNLLTNSWPYFGQDAMWKSLGQMYNSKNLQTVPSSGVDIARDPCVPKGYKFTINATDEKIVAGNFSLCTSHVRELLKRKQGRHCLQPPCEIVLSPSIKLRGIPVPFDKVFFISELFGLVPKASLSELEAAGHHYCEDDWYNLKSKYDNIDDLDLAKYCFSSAYLLALLRDNFGISMTDKRLGFATLGKNIPPAWIYGAFVIQILQEPLELKDENSEEIVGNDLVTYISLLTVFLIAVLGAVFLLKCQKPHLKTVYDLQKGRYIVTRLPR